jgi:peptide chain release factor subunit 1
MESISADTAAELQPPFPEGRAPGPQDALSGETIARITGFEPGELRVISVYMAIDPADRKSIPADVDSLLHQVRPLSKDQDLPHEVRMSLRQDIERIEELVKDELPIERAAAIFACSGGGLFEVVALPRAVGNRIRVDAIPWVRPMLAVFEEYERMIAVVLDRQGARLWEVYLGEERDAGRVKGPELRRRGAAGRRANSPQHHEDKADRLERQFFKDLVHALEHLSYDVLVFGGHEQELAHLVEMLPQPMSERTIGTFAIDPSTATPAEVRDRAQAILDDHDRERQRGLVDEVAEAVAAGGRGTLGLEHCLWAASVDAVDTLLVQAGATAPGVVCEESHWLATSGDICPLCGQETRATEDVIEDLVEMVSDEGGHVRHVREDTIMRRHVTGARLRFPLPPDPREASA